MRFCPSCNREWGDEVKICHTVNDKTRRVCNRRLLQQ